MQFMLIYSRSSLVWLFVHILFRIAINFSFVCPHCSMQFIALYAICPKVICYSLHVHGRVLKYQGIMYGLCLIKITTKYHIYVSKVLCLYMFYAS
jgi:hypothetical protein